MKHTPSRTMPWYVSAIACFYSVICSIFSLRYLAMDLGILPGQVAITTQVLCFGATLSAVVYLIRPTAGCWGLLVVTLVALITAPFPREAEAIVFHVAIAAMLIWALRQARTTT